MYSDGGSGGDGWSSSFSLLEENGSCQGSPWEPDNVKVETARRSVGGTCWALLGPGQLYSLPGGWTGLGMPAVSGSPAQGASGVGHGSALLALGCLRREGAPGQRICPPSLSSLCGAHPHLLPLSHVTGCDPSKKTTLASSVLSHP